MIKLVYESIKQWLKIERIFTLDSMQLPLINTKKNVHDTSMLLSERTEFQTFHRAVKFIDLFAGIGGMRKGFEKACTNKGLNAMCVFTSEIKPHAICVLQQNNPSDQVHGDITKVNSFDIPDFDILLAGFPCQAFSFAGKRLGFSDTRGTLFFDVLRVLKDKKPFGFILENVEGLVTHDRIDSKDKIGRTLETILFSLEDLGYKVSWRVFNAKNFGVPQERKRVYIVGTQIAIPDLEAYDLTSSYLSSIIESGLPCKKSAFIDLLLSHFSVDELYGRAIKDKRGGSNNIHSWDIEYKGSVTDEQKKLLNAMMRERRKKKWADDYGIDWMDGMPLTIDHIKTFYCHNSLESMLKDLVYKGYIKMEHPKRKVGSKRIQDKELPLGYNIVAGKMSFEVSKVLDPDSVAPTLVAMDMHRLFIGDNGGLRNLSLREGLRLFGYPDDFKFEIDQESGFDLLGNTVVVPVITAVSERVLNEYIKELKNEINTSRSLQLSS